MDTLVTIKKGVIVTDLYKKPTDRCQYLLPSSCHPAHVTNNIPYSMAYRVLRICSETVTRDKRMEELKELFISRQYNVKMTDLAIARAKLVPREQALLRVKKQ